MRTAFIIVLLCICNSLIGHSQSVKLFSADKELSNSLIYNICQDKNGIVWIATEDGLNQYDGSKFTIYKHEKKDPLSLGNNFVRMLFEDSQGHFFVGHIRGLQLYDYATDTFQDIPMILKNGEIAKSHVTSIIERKNGEIIIGTSGEGIYQLKEDGGQLYAQQESWLVPSLHIICVYEDKEENLWVSTEDKGLYLLTKNNNLISFFRHNNIVLHNISSICEDNQGNLLVGSMTRGLFIFNKDIMSFSPIHYPGKPDLPIKTLYTDGSNDVYIGTDGCGVMLYNSTNKKITDNTFNVNIFDLEKSKVHALLKDNAGNIWMGIYQKGVILVPVQTNKFEYIGYKSVKRNMIGSNCIMSIFEDSEQILWVGTDNDGLYGLEKGGTPIHYSHSSAQSSVPPTILSIYEDSNQDLWLGSYLNGMAKMNKRTGECRYVTNLLDDNQNQIQRVYAFQEDANKRLWIGTMGFGLYSMDLNTGEITNHNRMPAAGLSEEENYLMNNWIDCLLLTKDQKLFIGTYNGLICLDLKTNSYISTFGQLSILPGHVIYALYEDEQGNLYVGTSDGLISIDKETHQTTVYTTEEGLPNNVVCAIKGDQNHHLWISTNYGISQFNLINKTFVNYYANDGLQGNEFSKGAALINTHGEFLFGGLSGITYFNPLNISSQLQKLKIRITDFYIYNQSVKKYPKSGRYTILKGSVMNAEQFDLSHNDNSFSFEFSTMEFNTPERIAYQYSINDEEWISMLPGINRISFSNLAPGKYQFRVKAKDDHSISEERNVTVVIHPPWYLTAWAKLAYFLIFLLAIYLTALGVRQRFRSRQRMIEHQHSEEINEAKLQFFMNIAHEIRTPMSLVISPLKRLMKSDPDDERQKSYRMIQRNAERILNLINQLIDIRKIDKGIMTLTFQQMDLVSFIGDLYTYFEYHAKTKNIDFQFHTPLKVLDVWIDPKNFDKIILNVLTNAFRFTQENGKIDVSLNVIDVETDNEGLVQYGEIIVSDNGIGIDEAERERIFERYYQIRNSYNSTNISTGIGLHLTRSLVELHHGMIWVESNEGGGSSFIIRIPMGKEHLNPEDIKENNERLVIVPERTELVPEPSSDGTKEKTKSKTKYRIMIVEDDEEIRKYICSVLASDYHMIECADGKEALASILKKAPDLVISDIMMAEMDGITLCRKIKQNIHINHIPVVLLTARSREEDYLDGLSTGADAYIVKPFNMDLLRKTIENLIRNRELLRNTYEGNQLREDKVKKVEMKSSDEKLMERIMKVINANLSNPELSVESIAEQVGISRVHLHRKLKELTNQTTRDFIRNIRLKQAADLLADKHLSISEVAEATGFTNLGHFSNAFKDLYGVPPSTYMSESKEKKEKEL